jgi:hypothetical protein
MFEAMVFKREIGAGSGLDVKMLETYKDGLVLTFEQNAVNIDNLEFIKKFVSQHNLSLLLDSESYFISTNVLKPSNLTVWEN